MIELKRYLMKTFVIISTLLAVLISVVDSIFDELTIYINNQYIMVLALVLFFTVQILILLISAFVFARLSSKGISKFNEQSQKDTNLLFANIAHDLKTPLTTVIGYSKALRDGVVESDDERQSMLSTVTTKAERVNMLLDLMFQYTKLNANDVSLSMQEYDITKLVRQIIAEHYDEFEEKRINLEIDIPTMPINILMDIREMNRALTNLIINAYTHNMSGSNVMIQIKKAGVKQFKIVVADDGLNIPKEVHEDLFKPFFINDDTRNNSIGSGLGLSITKAIVEKHGYHIAIEEMKDRKYTKAFVMMTWT